MAVKNIWCGFDKDIIWTKVCGRRPVVLDMNCWIDMADEAFPLATRVRATLQKLVSDGVAFCPLSFGLLSELYKQTEDSRLRVGTLMEELSLNVTYVPREDVFAWEVERAVRRLADIGPIDLSLCGLYGPVLAYLATELRLALPDEIPSAVAEDCGKYMRTKLAALTLTEMLKMRVEEGDRIFDTVNQFPPPKYSDEAKRIRELTKGNKHKERAIEAISVMKLYVFPAMEMLPSSFLDRLMRHIDAVYKGDYGRFLTDFLEQLPSIENHIEIMATVCQFPTRKDKMNHFYDMEIMPVPLAYASIFVAKDKGIRDILNRTVILKRNRERKGCRYCYDLAELEECLKVGTLS